MRPAGNPTGCFIWKELRMVLIAAHILTGLFITMMGIFLFGLWSNHKMLNPWIGIIVMALGILILSLAYFKKFVVI